MANTTNRLPEEGISLSGAGARPTLGSTGVVEGMPNAKTNPGLGHTVPAAASDSGSALGEVRPGGTQGEQMPAPGGPIPEVAGPGGPEEI